MFFSAHLGTSMDARVVHSPVTGLYETSSWYQNHYFAYQQKGTKLTKVATTCWS
jgi:hypothetical protein